MITEQITRYLQVGIELREAPFGGGFDRGHIVPSADRTRDVATNSETFLMTNFIPQGSNNNQGPWNNMEQYLRSLFPNELYTSLLVVKDLSVVHLVVVM